MFPFNIFFCVHRRNQNLWNHDLRNIDAAPELEPIKISLFYFPIFLRVVIERRCEWEKKSSRFIEALEFVPFFSNKYI